MKKLLFLLLTAFYFVPALAQIEVSRLYVENKINPLGISCLYPRLSWSMSAPGRNVKQTAFDIRVSENLTSLQKGMDLIFSTGKIPSDQSVFVQFTGNTLKPGRKYYWQVRVWDQDDRASKWSEPNFWVMGLMGPENWVAKWIQPGFFNKDEVQSSLFRKEFVVDKPIRLAVAFITAYGMYEARLNGKRIGDAYLTPGWTNYDKRLQYQTYDVTQLLKEGKNALGVMLGDGWCKDKFVGEKGADPRLRQSLLLQMQLIYADGSVENILSDGSWRSAKAPVLSSDIYDGETYDARLNQEGWSEPGFVDVDWAAIKLVNLPVINTISSESELIRKHESFTPVQVLTTPKGETVLDFGQNLSGWVQVKATGKAGDKITIQHAEVLDKAGNFYTKNLRSAKQTNTYILNGSKEEVFEPHFSYQGFRFIKVEGYPGELKAENFKAYAVYADMQPTGNFSCSDDLLNKLQKNIQWSQRSNFLDVPTACSQRDERVGSAAEAQVFAPTAAFNFNVHSFYSKWLQDLKSSQRPNGSVPGIIPTTCKELASPGWSDAATIIPWGIYRKYGDQNLLENQYESMVAWINYIRKSTSDYLWKPLNSPGDWLFYRPDDDNSGRAAATGKDMIGQFFYANSTQLVIEAAKVLDKQYDVQFYDSLLTNIKDAFVHEYVTPSGRIVSGTQTAYVLALQFDMLPESMRADAIRRLVNNIESYDGHLTTGILGTPYLCDVLSRFGYGEVAYQVLLAKSYPSWLYPITMGATTIWERWDGIRPDGSFQTADMNSFNHCAFGSVGDWMYRVAAGIDVDPVVAGYKKIQVKPLVTKQLLFVKANLNTYYGEIVSEWRWLQGRLLMNVTIPVNTSAKIFIPAKSSDKVREGGRSLQAVRELKVVGQKDDYVQIEAGSGTYRFTVAP